MILTKQLRNARIAQNKTLRQLAEETGISYQYISDIELGRKDPSLRVLKRLAEALKLTILLIPNDKN
ncbi:helix-turn-helix transcriptional regulator [Desulfallas sp. Bu1-1]|uniref:helix-turn-helix domain-containing protein n=1 Tax=Desulfallas sp. Bu1-1 TaxID=2787620 RepID=UPI00189D8C92|nr:helix-turn-helix transcriptional regulator [Desulfallas sp. Bu1-1]MBF7082836.1 helix-turn-helix transcriptional regulator [Desulfallas sp. Bu1-1]